MKKFIQLITLTLVLVSCGSDNGQFRLEGRFRNLNQGEFYVYASGPDADGIDTIRVADGRFAYEKALQNKVTLMMVFPNFTEQAIFAEPGKKVKIKGDASHLREMEISGTDDNELFTQFRLHTNEMTPPQLIKEVETFVGKHPESAVSLHLIIKYLVQGASPDYAKAYRLTALMAKAQDKGSEAEKLNRQLKNLKNGNLNASLPSFKATDLKGKKVDRSKLKAKVNVVNVWATWNYNSVAALRRLNKLQTEYKDSLAIVSINLDATTRQCEEAIKRDSLSWPIVCDTKIWKSTLLRTFGIQTMGNLIADKSGKVIARDLTAQELEDRIRQLMKK